MLTLTRICLSKVVYVGRIHLQIYFIPWSPPHPTASWLSSTRKWPVVFWITEKKFTHANIKRFKKFFPGVTGCVKFKFSCTKSVCLVALENAAFLLAFHG